MRPLLSLLAIFLIVGLALAQAQTSQWQDDPPMRDWDRFGESSPSFGYPPTTFGTLFSGEYAAHDSNVTLLGRWAWGPCQTVDAQGNLAYIGNGTAFQVLDISNPSSPRLIGELMLPDLVIDIRVSGDYAYVSAWKAGLRIVDISDPTRPAEVGSYDEAVVGDMAVSGNYVYVADQKHGGLIILDVSVTTDPRLAGYLEAGMISGIEICDDYAYLSESGIYRGRLVIVDVSDPANPHEEGAARTPGMAQGLALSGRYVYVADHTEGLRVFDVSVPSDPKAIGSLYTSGVAFCVVLNGDLAYVLEASRGILIVDVSDPTHPSPLTRRETEFMAMRGMILQDILFIADFTGLMTFDVSLPRQPVKAGRFETAYFATAVAAYGDYAFVAEGWAGVWGLDISNPARPQVVSHIDTEWPAWDMVISGNYIYVAVGLPGLQVWDFSDPVHPVLAGNLERKYYIENMVISGDFIYAVEAFEGFSVIDISDPGQPIEVSHIPLESYGADVAISGDYAYVADGIAGLHIFNISRPTHPEVIGHYHPDGWIDRVAVSGHYVYILFDTGSGERSMWTLDMSNPANPTVTDSLSLVVIDMTVSGNYLYVLGWESPEVKVEAKVLDISDPTHPIQVGYFHMTSQMLYSSMAGGDPRLMVAGNRIYLAWGSSGLYILQNDLLRKEKGDVNSDGIVDVTDVIEVVNIIIKSPPPPTQNELWAADYDNDGRINAMDVVGIIKSILGRPVSGVGVGPS